VLKRRTEATLDGLVAAPVVQAMAAHDRALWQRVADAYALVPNSTPLLLPHIFRSPHTAAAASAAAARPFDESDAGDGGGSATAAEAAVLPSKRARTSEAPPVTDHGMPVLSLMELMKRLQSPTASRMRTLNRNVVRRM
jgi:hypothetical protein